MKKLALSIVLMSFFTAAHATENSVPLVNKKYDVASFGVQAAAMVFTYAKDVRYVDGKAIVDVVILDKLCHVTVSEYNDGLVAEKIDCDKGKYLKDGSTVL